MHFVFNEARGALRANGSASNLRRVRRSRLSSLIYIYGNVRIVFVLIQTRGHTYYYDVYIENIDVHHSYGTEFVADSHRRLVITFIEV